MAVLAASGMNGLSINRLTSLVSTDILQLLISAVFTVINEGNNRVRLHNNNNFLAIINGTTVLVNGVCILHSIIFIQVEFMRGLFSV